MMKWCLTLILGVLIVVPVRAGQVVDDFAVGFTAEPDEAGPLVDLSVPETVYETVVRPDLGDLRVFNRDGAVVPHVVRRAIAGLADQPVPRSLPFFPLRGGRTEDGAARQALRIVTDERGAIINVSREDVPQDDTVTAYLIDASALPNMPNRLELAWEGEDAEGFAVTVDVGASEDLARWRGVVSGVTLADLRSGGAALVHRAITLPPFSGKYLRIEWPATLRDVRLTEVHGFFPAQAQTLTRETMRARGIPIDDEPGAYEVDTGGVRPVDKIRLLFEERNAVVDAVLLSRATPDQTWQQRHAGSFYHLEREGASLQNEPVGIALTTDRYWRLEIAGGEEWAGRAPTLELSWVPDRLTVVAQGDGPFTVAFGSATVSGADRTADGLLSVINDRETGALIASARVSDIFVLGGESRLQPPPAPLPWRIWILWGVLIAGVGLLGWMVRQLIARVTPSS